MWPHCSRTKRRQSIGIKVEAMEEMDVSGSIKVKIESIDMPGLLREHYRAVNKLPVVRHEVEADRTTEEGFAPVIVSSGTTI